MDMEKVFKTLHMFDEELSEAAIVLGYTARKNVCLDTMYQGLQFGNNLHYLNTLQTITEQDIYVFSILGDLIDRIHATFTLEGNAFMTATMRYLEEVSWDLPEGDTRIMVMDFFRYITLMHVVAKNSGVYKAIDNHEQRSMYTLRKDIQSVANSVQLGSILVLYHVQIRSALEEYEKSKYENITVLREEGGVLLYDGTYSIPKAPNNGSVHIFITSKLKYIDKVLESNSGKFITVYVTDDVTLEVQRCTHTTCTMVEGRLKLNNITTDYDRYPA